MFTPQIQCDNRFLRAPTTQTQAIFIGQFRKLVEASENFVQTVQRCDRVNKDTEHVTAGQYNKR